MERVRCLPVSVMLKHTIYHFRGPLLAKNGESPLIFSTAENELVRVNHWKYNIIGLVPYEYFDSKKW